MARVRSWPKLSAAALFTASLVLPAPATALQMKPHKHAAMVSIESMENQWRTAQMNDDVTAMDKLLSDDFIGITASGNVVTKAQQLDRMRSREIEIKTLDVAETKVKMRGTFAVVTSLATITGTNRGLPLNGSFRYTRIYQRQPNGTWRITNFEATRIPEPGKEPVRRREHTGENGEAHH